MRGNVRSQLRTLLIIWATAQVTLIMGYGAALYLFILGLIQAAKSFATNPLPTLLPMVLGTGLQLVLAVPIVGVRDRFENRCWSLIEAYTAMPTDDEDVAHVVRAQANGRDDRLAAVDARRSRRFRRRLAALIEQAWPRSPS